MTKIYVLTKYGLKYDTAGYFSSRREDMEKQLEGLEGLGFKLEEATIEFKE